MNDDRPSPAPPVRAPMSWGAIFVALVLYGVGNFFYVSAVIDSPDYTGPALGLALITLIAAVLSFAASRGFALGLIAGYGLMTITSGGACTLLRPIGDYGEGGALVGLAVYPIAVLLFGIAALARYLASRSRNAR